MRNQPAGFDRPRRRGYILNDRGRETPIKVPLDRPNSVLRRSFPAYAHQRAAVYLESEMHTPGPWESTEHDDGQLLTQSGHRYVGQFVIHCAIGTEKVGGITALAIVPRTSEVSYRNARLIAASPTMLAALKAIDAELRFLAAQGKAREKPSLAVIDQIIKAIALAEAPTA